MRRVSIFCSVLILSACQASPPLPQQQFQPLTRLQTQAQNTAAEVAPVVIQKSPVLAAVKLKPEGQIQIKDQTVKLILKMPALENDFQTQALDLSGDNATQIVATVSDSHGLSYTPVGAVSGKVAYPANGQLVLTFNNVVPDQLLFLELQVVDNAAGSIPQAMLAAVVSQTGVTDITAPVNFQTTPTAKAMKTLLAANAVRARAINLPDLVTKVAEITGLAGGANPTYTTHPSLVDTDLLATDLLTKEAIDLTPVAPYQQVGATIALTVNGLVGTDKIEVDVTDAASTRATDVGATGSITKATPGSLLKVKVGEKAGNTTQYTFAINPTPITLTNNATTNVTITATPTPVTITSLTPGFGVLGTTVTIAGSGFSTLASNNTVKFGSTTATISSVNVTGTSMDVIVPAGVSGSQSVTVKVGSQTSAASNFEVVPVISSLDTVTGTVGSTVVITGTGFSATPASNIVKFGTVTATVNIASATSLNVTVPAGAAGSQPVTVKVDNSTSGTSAYNVTPVLSALATATATPDTILTLTGSGFSTTLADNNIKFGSTIVNPISSTGTSMTVTVPNVFGSMNLSVTVAGQASVNRTFESIPKITSLSPLTGSTGNSIVLTGKGFHTTFGSNTVKFGTVTGTVTAATATTVTVSVPETPAKTANATVTVGTQTSAASGFSILPRLTSLTTAEVVATKAVLIRSQELTIAGTNFDTVKANNSVTFTLSNSTTVTVAGADLTSASATQIKVNVPAGVDVAGNVDVKVITNAKTSAALIGFVPTVTLNVNNGGFH